MPIKVVNQGFKTYDKTFDARTHTGLLKVTADTEEEAANLSRIAGAICHYPGCALIAINADGETIYLGKPEDGERLFRQVASDFPNWIKLNG